VLKSKAYFSIVRQKPIGTLAGCDDAVRMKKQRTQRQARTRQAWYPTFEWERLPSADASGRPVRRDFDINLLSVNHDGLPKIYAQSSAASCRWSPHFAVCWAFEARRAADPNNRVWSSSVQSLKARCSRDRIGALFVLKAAAGRSLRDRIITAAQ
jgi:hypothetical protein